MRILFYPFFSQQDKATGKFLMASDSGVRLYCYIANRLQQAGHTCCIVEPPASQTAPWVAPVQTIRVPHFVATDNGERRLQWDPLWLKNIGQEFDVVFTTHDFLAIPLRMLSNVKIVLEAGVTPDLAWPKMRELFPLAWSAADAVHCNTLELLKLVAPYNSRVDVLQFSYESELATPRQLDRNVDILFNVRASATNYTCHREFIAAMRGTMYTISMTDPTGYLRQTQEAPAEWFYSRTPTRTEYERLLHRSKVVVSLAHGGGGTHSFREAIAAGCTPVCLRTTDTEILLGSDWPYFCKLDNIAEVCDMALRSPKPVPQGRIAHCSYEGAYDSLLNLLEGIL
jgi:hypothetical protein